MNQHEEVLKLMEKSLIKKGHDIRHLEPIFTEKDVVFPLGTSYVAYSINVNCNSIYLVEFEDKMNGINGHSEVRVHDVDICDINSPLIEEKFKMMLAKGAASFFYRHKRDSPDITNEISDYISNPSEYMGKIMKQWRVKNGRK